jgi:hypothetical protein
VDNNRIFIAGGERATLIPELIQNCVVKALTEANTVGQSNIEVYYQRCSSNLSGNGFIVLCVPSHDCNPQTLHHAVIRGLEAAYPQLSKDQRFSIVILKQTMYEG